MLKLVRFSVYWIPTDWLDVPHKGGRILDLDISRHSSTIVIRTPSVFDPYFSNNKGKSFGDHLAVRLIINMDKPNCIQRQIKYRTYIGLNIKECIEDLQSSQHLRNCERSVDKLVEAYNKMSRVSQYTMLLRIQISSRETRNPWYSDKLRSAKNIRRKAERTWHRTSLMVHFEIYRDFWRKISALPLEEKKYFYSTKIEECGNDQQKLFKLTKNLMGSNSNVNLQNFTSSDLLADKFSNNLKRKTTIVRSKIISDSSNNTCKISLGADIMINANVFEIFRPTSEV